MKKLSFLQELSILNKLSERTVLLGYGSSRAVYDLNKNYCVKVAMDEGGFVQNSTEVEMFEKYGIMHFAEIVAYGKNIVVMEKVNAYTPEEINSLLYEIDETEVLEDLCEEYDLTSRQIQQAEDLVHELDMIFDYTQDNMQIGINRQGDFVAYDYGYRPRDHEVSIGNVRDEIEMEGVLGFLLGVIEKMRIKT